MDKGATAGVWKEEPSKNLFNGMPVSRNVDPPSYDSKYKFWSERILQKQEEAKESCFSLSECRKYCSYNGLQPLSLIPIFEIMIQNDILTKQQAIEDRLSQQRSSFTWKCIKYMTSFIQSKNLKEEDTVIITEELRAQTENIWKLLGDSIVNNTDWSVTTKQLQHIYKESAECTNYKLIPWPILSQFMELEQILQPIYSPGATKTDSNIIGYKFLKYVPNFTWNRPRVAITSQIDSHVLTLRTTIEKTEAQEEKMKNKALEAKQKALEYSASKQKKIALLYIKRYNCYQEKQIEQVTTKHKLEDLLMNIQGAETNVQLVDTYKSAKFALDDVLDGLDVDQVDDIVLSLQESIEKQQQIDSALDFTSVQDEEFDSLEMELAELTKEAEQNTNSVEKHTEQQEESILPTLSIPEKNLTPHGEKVDTEQAEISEQNIDESIESMMAELEAMSVCSDELEPRIVTGNTEQVMETD